MKRLVLLLEILISLFFLPHGLTQHLIKPEFVNLLENNPEWSMIGNIVLEESEYRGDIVQRLHNVLVSLKSSSFPTAVASNISQKCIDDSQTYVHSLYTSLSQWALQMQESSGHLPPGLFGSANFHADGLFDECQAVQAPGFDGQYCTAFFKPVLVDPSDIISMQQVEKQEGRSNFITIFQLLGLLSESDRTKPRLLAPDFNSYFLPSLSLCLPSTCSADDFGQAVAQLVGEYVIGNYSIVTVTDENYCFKENNPPVQLNGADICVIVTFSILGLLVVLATVHECWRMYCGAGFDRRKDGQLISALHCFSALSNGRKILSMKVSASNDNLSCLHGIRFFSTCWVVLGHSWSFSLYKTMNPRAIKADALNWGFQTVANGTIAVDTFLVMSGLLVSYLLLRELDRNNGRFNIGLFYLHRYLRLTLVYGVILGFIATLMVYIGTGPNWFTVIRTSNACRIEWWKQFLYINNLFPTENFLMCMGQSWYLAVDMQLFLISPLLIYPIWRWRKFGLFWLALVALASHAAIFAVYAFYDLMPTAMLTRVADNVATSQDFYVHYYVKSWTRAPPYLVGILTGWYLNVTQQSSRKLSKSLIALGWTVSAVVGLAVLYGLTPYLDPSKVQEIDPIVKMTYGPLHRTAWAMSIAWIIFACSLGYGGFVNRFLSWKGFLPLSRLTYCVYLIHYDYLNVFYAAVRKQYYYTMLDQFTICFGGIVTSFGLAFVASVTLEASFLNFEKLVFSSRKIGEGVSKIHPDMNVVKEQ